MLYNPESVQVTGFRSSSSMGVKLSSFMKLTPITKFEHADIHDELQTAIDNMRALKNYTVEFLNIGGSQFASGYSNPSR